MSRNNNKDWTDELCASVSQAGVEPSDGAWERLAAAVPARRAAWIPYAMAAALCCMAVCAVFIFRNPSPAPEIMAGSDSPVAAVPEAVSEADAAAADVSDAVPDPALLAMAVTSEPAGRTGRRPEPERMDAAVPVSEENPAGLMPSEAGCPREIREDDAELPAPEAAVSPVESVQDPFAADEDEARRPVRKVAVSASLGGGLASRSASVVTRRVAQSNLLAVKGGADPLRYEDVVDVADIIDHDAPLRLGIDVLVPLSSRLNIRTGLQFTSLRSSVGNGGQIVQWLGIPLGVGCTVADWGFSKLDAGASVMGEKCMGAYLLGMSYSEKTQWSLGLDASWRVKISGPLYFTLSPELSYYFTQTELPTYRTSHPLSFTLNAGFTFQL